MGFGQRAGNFNELGKVLSVKPSTGTPMTLVNSYQISSSGQPANVIHARDPIFKPGTETVINANATFFEPVESYDAKGVPQYSQFVIDAAAGSPNIHVSQYKEKFNVTDPGVMGTQGFFANGSNSGAVTRVPRALSLPVTRRRSGTVDVYLTTTNATDVEDAYQDDGVEWCSISFSTFTTGATNSTASVSASFRTFNKYLRSTDSTFPATGTTSVSSAGVYAARADSVATGDPATDGDPSESEYQKTGIFRSQTVPFMKNAAGAQLYLKTNVTFA